MILLDTHAFLWMHQNNSRLSKKAKDILSQCSMYSISAFTPLEIALLVKKGRIDVPCTPDIWFRGLFKVPRLRILPLTPSIAIRSVELPMHKDPADRIIVATALEHGLSLISVDEKIHASGLVSVVW